MVSFPSSGNILSMVREGAGEHLVLGDHVAAVATAAEQGQDEAGGVVEHTQAEGCRGRRMSSATSSRCQGYGAVSGTKAPPAAGPDQLWSTAPPP